MMAERAEAPDQGRLLSDDEVRDRLLANQDVRARAEELVKEILNGGPRGPRVKPEELSDFLREFGLEPGQGKAR